MSSSPLFQLHQQVWNPARTRITIAPNVGVNRWNGVIRGPFSAKSRTLPANFDLQWEPSGAATCDIIDPCAWSPKLPLWYELQATIESADGATQVNQKIALRDSRIVGDRCYAAGERKVFRIVSGEAVKTFQWSQWRESRTAVFTNSVSDEMLAQSLNEGVCLFVYREETSPDQWRYLHSFASVVGIISPNNPGAQYDNGVGCWKLFHARTPDCLQQDTGWADAVWVSESLLETANKVVGASKPIFVTSDIGADSNQELAAVRSQCDSLQRRTAGVMQCAGYAAIS